MTFWSSVRMNALTHTHSQMAPSSRDIPAAGRRRLLGEAGATRFQTHEKQFIKMAAECLAWFCSRGLERRSECQIGVTALLCVQLKEHTLSFAAPPWSKRGTIKINPQIDFESVCGVWKWRQSALVSLRVLVSLRLSECALTLSCISQGPLWSKTTLQVLLFKGVSAAGVSAAGARSFQPCGDGNILERPSSSKPWVKLSVTRFSTSLAEYNNRAARVSFTKVPPCVIGTNGVVCTNTRRQLGFMNLQDRYRDGSCSFKAACLLLFVSEMVAWSVWCFLALKLLRWITSHVFA